MCVPWMSLLIYYLCSISPEIQWCIIPSAPSSAFAQDMMLEGFGLTVDWSAHLGCHWLRCCRSALCCSRRCLPGHRWIESDSRSAACCCCTGRCCWLQRWWGWCSLGHCYWPSLSGKRCSPAQEASAVSFRFQEVRDRKELSDRGREHASVTVLRVTAPCNAMTVLKQRGAASIS